MIHTDRKDGELYLAFDVHIVFYTLIEIIVGILWLAYIHTHTYNSTNIKKKNVYPGGF